MKCVRFDGGQVVTSASEDKDSVQIHECLLIECADGDIDCDSRAQRVIFVGSSNDADAMLSSNADLLVTRHVKLNGRTVLPGLWDSHIHVLYLGSQYDQVDLSGCQSVSELRTRLAHFIKRQRSSLAPGAWIVGRGWDQVTMGNQLPSKEDLDAVENEVPVVLFRQCHHIVVVNSAALRAIGYDASTPDPDGGVIDRIEGSSEPSGVLRENAVEKVYKAKGAGETRAMHKEWIALGLQKCLANGLVSVQTNDTESWPLYKELANEGRVPIRVYLTVMNSELENDDLPVAGSRHSELVSVGRMKFFADGSLGATTAALIEPYSHRHVDGHSGTLIFPLEKLTSRMKDATERGFQIEVHVIGDLAADQALKALRGAGVTPEHRPVMTHCQVMSERLFEEMRVIGAVANVQPQFVDTDQLWAERYLGAERLATSYAWKTMLKRKIAVAGGSDAPIEEPDPILGMCSAMDHKIHEHESFTFAEALRLYTTSGVHASRDHRSHLSGELCVGTAADLVVLSGRLSPQQALADFRSLHGKGAVDQVWVNGVCRFEREVAGPDGAM